MSKKLSYLELTDDQQDIAETWRLENGYTGKGGVVVVFDGEVQSWCNELRNPEHWQPGCVAVDEDGNEWVATDGNCHNGAEKWLAMPDTQVKQTHG